MTISWEFAKVFWDYLEFYSEEDAPDFGGIKGIQDSAPKEAKKAFKKFMNQMKKCQIEVLNEKDAT